MPGKKHHRGKAMAIMPARQRAAQRRAETAAPPPIPDAQHGGPTSLPAPTPMSEVTFRPSSDPWDIR